MIPSTPQQNFPQLLLCFKKLLSLLNYHTHPTQVETKAAFMLRVTENEVTTHSLSITTINPQGKIKLETDRKRQTDQNAKAVSPTGI